MTNQEILQIALEQSAIDCNCKTEDFLATENKVVMSRKHEKARAYLPLPFYCAAWSNIKSVRNAMKCGFCPAWVELTARSSEFVDKMNE